MITEICHSTFSVKVLTEICHSTFSVKVLTEIWSLVKSIAKLSSDGESNKMYETFFKKNKQEKNESKNTINKCNNNKSMMY